MVNDCVNNELINVRIYVLSVVHMVEFKAEECSERNIDQ